MYTNFNKSTDTVIIHNPMKMLEITFSMICAANKFLTSRYFGIAGVCNLQDVRLTRSQWIY